MYLVSDLRKQSYKVNEVARILGVSTKTIRNYDEKGILKANRTVGNHRVILRDELIRYLDEKGMILDDTVKERRDIVYARVSSHDQKQHGDLDRQALYLVEHVPDMHNPLVLKEVGSGLNDKRKKLQQLLVMVSKGEVRNVYVTYKDRLTRFGFYYLETMFNACGTEIVIVKDADEEKTVQDELVEDMMSLIASFSGKLYGMRSRRPKMKKVRNLEELEELIDMESVERCFMEYMLTVIGQAKRAESLQAGCAVMEEEELEHFVGNIGKRDLKTVCATLVALGYSRKWVDGPLKEAFEKRYQI